MDVYHDVLELCVNLFLAPAQTLCVLAHLECGRCNAAGVNSLGRSNNETLAHEELEGVVRCRHVGNLDVVLDAVCDDLLCGLHEHVVLHCARHYDVNLAAERLLAREEFYAELVRIILYTVAAARVHLEHIVNLLFRYNAIGIIDVAVRTGKGDYLTAELGNLLCYAPSNITEA